MSSMVIAKSVLYSWENDQNPLSVRIETLVDTKATNIPISKGMAASLVSRPIKIRVPQAISKDPVKVAQKAGLLKPIFVNRPTPVASGVMNFCRPSERKISPTISLGMSTGTPVVFISLLFIGLPEYLITEWWSIWNFDLVKLEMGSLVAVIACVGQ